MNLVTLGIMEEHGRRFLTCRAEDKWIDSVWVVLICMESRMVLVVCMGSRVVVVCMEGIYAVCTDISLEMLVL